MTKQENVRVFLHRPKKKIWVGELSYQNREILFQYDHQFIEQEIPLSPYYLPLNRDIHRFSYRLFDGLPGVFNDSLPDGWGLLLMDRYFRSLKINLNDVTPLMRLAYVGDRAMGALSYEPATYEPHAKGEISLQQLAKASLSVYEGDSDKVISALLVSGGSPAGARPKAVVGLNPKSRHVIYGENHLPKSHEHYLIKFFSQQENQDAGKIEYALAMMAKKVGIEFPECHLLSCKAGDFFAVKRFDRERNQRIHMQSMSGLLHLDFRYPNNDYVDLLKLTADLTKNQEDVIKAFRLMVFNIAVNNRDDHIKNFSFMLKHNEWQLSPAYDLTFSSGPGGEHSMTVAGEGKAPRKTDVVNAAQAVGLSKKIIEPIIEEVLDVVSRWRQFAKKIDIKSSTIKQIDQVMQLNIRHLLG